MINTKQIEILPIGTEILIKNTAPIAATITSACIRGSDYVTYEASWMHDGTSRTAWFQPFEFTTEEAVERKQIGFTL